MEDAVAFEQTSPASCCRSRAAAAATDFPHRRRGRHDELAMVASRPLPWPDMPVQLRRSALPPPAAASFPTYEALFAARLSRQVGPTYDASVDLPHMPASRMEARTPLSADILPRQRSLFFPSPVSRPLSDYRLVHILLLCLQYPHCPCFSHIEFPLAPPDVLVSLIPLILYLHSLSLLMPSFRYTFLARRAL